MTLAQEEPMVGTTSRKNKVILTDYNYRKDIENRLLLAQLTIFDVDVLNEVINGSLVSLIPEIAEQLGVTTAQVIASLDKLAPTKLFRHDGNKIHVDKELRKYYEFQIQKFDDDFSPDLEFAFRALKRVPIQALPAWYGILRTTDEIQPSIIEKYLQSPKVYRRHLMDLQFDDPVILAIVKDVMAAQDFKISASTLRQKYGLSQALFEEYLLLLEFNFVCFLSYNRSGEVWEEVVMPLHEWREFLRFHHRHHPVSIPDSQVVRKHEGGEFAFVQDLTKVLTILQEQPLTFEKLGDFGDEAHLRSLVKRLQALQLIEIKDDQIHAAMQSRVWLRKLSQDQAHLLYRLPVNPQDYPTVNPELLIEKNFRSVERSLKRVTTKGWVDLEQFLDGMDEPLGVAEPVTLKQKGRRWCFALPTYDKAQRVFMREWICTRLYEVGIVLVGSYPGGICFQLTPFGRLAIGD